MSINAKEIRDFTFQNTEYITNIIARYSVYESLYRYSHIVRSTDALQRFEEGVVETYKCVLQFVGHMKDYLVNQNCFGISH